MTDDQDMTEEQDMTKGDDPSALEEIVNIRTDRLGVLVEQLTEGVQLSRTRIDGVTDDEMVWEPTPASWSVRARSDATTPNAYGPGEYVLDHDSSADPFANATVSTIAWRVGHLVSMFAGRWEWTFGERSMDPADLVDFVPGVSMVDRMWDEIDRWATSLEGLTDEQLDEVGFGQYPWGLDPHIAFIGIIRWMNRETIHHLAEIALLRDLYAART
jgi:hypothetical protein